MIVDDVQRGARLVALAVGHDHELRGTEAAQGAADPPAVQAPDATRGDQDDASVAELGQQLRRERRQAVADGDRVAAWPQLDGDLDHDAEKITRLSAADGPAVCRSRLSQPAGQRARASGALLEVVLLLPSLLFEAAQLFFALAARGGAATSASRLAPEGGDPLRELALALLVPRRLTAPVGLLALSRGGLVLVGLAGRGRASRASTSSGTGRGLGGLRAGRARGYAGHAGLIAIGGRRAPDRRWCRRGRTDGCPRRRRRARASASGRRGRRSRAGKTKGTSWDSFLERAGGGARPEPWAARR